MIAKANYRFTPKWNVFVKGMYETASVTEESAGIKDGKYRTSLGYLTGLEYYPMESNLHFFLTYVGRKYIYSDLAESLGFKDYNTNRVSIGFIYQLQIF